MSEEIQSVSDEPKGDNKKILEQIREHFRQAEEASADVREAAQSDLEFRAGHQWPEELKNERTLDGRPCIVVNKMPQFVRQVTNDQKLNRSAIKVSPVDSKGDLETAKVLQGMIRHIENQSSADLAYDSAFEGAVTKGFGFYRILTEYCDEMSFNQEIKIKGIDNHFSVYFDPNSKELDGSDASFAFVFDEMSKEDFKSQYPEADLTAMADWTSIGDNVENWVTENKCRIAEYFYKEFKPVEIALLQDGTVLERSKIPDDLKSLIVKERTAQTPTVKWMKTNGIEILEETVWPSKWIPIIPVYGERLNVNGEIILESVIRHAKDPQRLYNYFTSSESETIGLAPRAPYLAVDGQIPKEFEKYWRTANRKNHPYLPYVAMVEGQVYPPPQRQAFEAPIQAISHARLQANDDIKDTTGIQDASRGIQSNEKSGVAIKARTQQSQTSNYHFISNSNASKRHCGRILVDIIPKIYDAAQAVRIIGDDDKEEIVEINKIFIKNGVETMHNLGIGKYDVVIETGPSFATKQQEAATAMVELAGVVPQIGQVAPDLMVQNMSLLNGKEISNRLRKILPPGVADDGQSENIPPEVRAKLGQQEQMIMQLSGKLEETTAIIREKRVELESKERIEFAKLEAQLAIAQANNESKEALAGLQTYMSSMADEMAMVKQRLQLLNINTPISNESGGYPAAIQPNQQPTGGISPGQFNGEQP